MKQFTIALFSLLCIWGMVPQDVNAQAFENGDKVLNLGLGFGGRGDLGFGTPSFGASFEVGIIETGDFGVVGVGAYAGYRSGNYSVFLNDDYKVSTLVVAPRGTFHVTAIEVEKLDVYAAIELGLAFVTVKVPGFSNTSSTDFEPSLIVGARYYFSDNIGAFAELGLNGFAGFGLGVSFRF
jgi:hypothetical protein